MTKTKIIRIYTVASIIVGFVLFFFSLSYVGNFTNITFSFNQVAGEFFGSVEKSLMNITLSMYGADLVLFNIMGIIALSALILNVVFVILIGTTEDVEHKLLKDVFQVNLIVSLIIFLGVLLFIYMIPEKINGEIVSYFIFVKMPVLSSETRYVINVMYIGSLFYILYNFFVFVKTLPESVTELDEELYAEEFYTHLEEPDEDEDDLDK
jgi:ABC-type anion transport system duplicated permease subunit